MFVTVIGAGFGGLSAAALLAKEGYNVTLLEKNSVPGGRARVLREKGFSFDMGPSWYLMPDVFESFFKEFNKKPDDFYNLLRIDPSYRIFFDGEQIVDVSANLEDNYELFNSFEEGGGDKLRRYLEQAEHHYRLAMDEMIYREYDRIWDLFSGKLALEGFKLPLFNNIDGYVSKWFKSPKSKKILEYSIGFIGGSPHNTPALYYIMNHVDFKLGVWYPAEGGIGRVVDALVELCNYYGVEIKYDEEALKLESEGPNVKRVITEKEVYEPDLVIVNADYPHTEINLLEPQNQTYGENYWESKTMAPSALVIYIGLNKKLPNMDHHNLFLTKDWDQGFESIFNPKKAQWPETPSYYINITSKYDPTTAPEGCETIFVLVPLAPDLEDTPEIREKYYKKLVSHIETLAGEPIIGHEVVKQIFAINDFKKDYNAYKGTALGLTHSLLQTAFFRPSHKSKKLDNLYYTGHYTHPGIGMPMCLISSQVLSKSILEKYGGDLHN
jgi:1-hydroxy-2-isopentenylcarotenoid 3,4-desaturase